MTPVSSIMDFMSSITEPENKNAECIFCNGEFFENLRGEIWIKGLNLFLCAPPESTGILIGCYKSVKWTWLQLMYLTKKSEFLLVGVLRHNSLIGCLCMRKMAFIGMRSSMCMKVVYVMVGGAYTIGRS
ncbi:hypothetical protein TNCV_1511311 [Trichonephila clavipes]|nr:hypothetical protein TNCV_1511311 [Trichonephila clavipes]